MIDKPKCCALPRIRSHVKERCRTEGGSQITTYVREWECRRCGRVIATLPLEQMNQFVKVSPESLEGEK